MAQTTKKRIMDGFLELLEQRPLDKISVVDIADHCGINRNTFYYYYCDVYALIRELMEVRAQQLITDNQEDLNWIEITREVTSFFRTRRRHRVPGGAAGTGNLRGRGGTHRLHPTGPRRPVALARLGRRGPLADLVSAGQSAIHPHSTLQQAAAHAAARPAATARAAERNP